MKKILISLLCVFAISSAFAAPVKPTVATHEDYKSYQPNNNFTMGASGGFGLVDTHGGFSLIGNVATKIVKDGWVPDIVNPVFLEVEFGPIFTSGATFWEYSAHFRWDFVKDRNWTLFALGGFGGSIADNKWGDRVAVHPRFGVGAFYSLDALDLRFEFSHELITAGISLPF
ncbi:MAG: hypothetical protein H7301_15535 [Cryobacterium sp.]|nr:hypothetical protein [Oligoflexia bacterium]